LKLVFKKIIAFSTLAVLVGVGMFFALAYLSKPKSPSQTLPTAQVADDRLQLTMTLEKTTYTLGKPINITLTITNISNHTIDYQYSRGCYDFWVYNDTDNYLYKWSDFRAFPDTLIMWHLNPKEGFTTVLVWRQTCNETWFSQEGTPVSPGTYYIVGQAGHMFPLQTTPIQIAID
jgi:hypothetical protein